MNQTTSSNWQGNQVGISRVEYELFKNLNFIGFVRTYDGFIPYTDANQLKKNTSRKSHFP
jgi:hypothetical protein